jgi:hypothetical protein
LIGVQKIVVAEANRSSGSRNSASAARSAQVMTTPPDGIRKSQWSGSAMW